MPNLDPLYHPFLNNQYPLTQEEWALAEKFRDTIIAADPLIGSFKLERERYPELVHGFECIRLEDGTHQLICLDRDDYLGAGVTGKVKKGITKEGLKKAVRVSDANLEKNERHNYHYRLANIIRVLGKLNQGFHTYIRESNQPKSIFKHQKLKDLFPERSDPVNTNAKRVEIYDYLGSHDLLGYLQTHPQVDTKKFAILRLIIGLKACLALQELHDVHEIHRDLKAENMTVLIEDFLVNLKLIDFEAAIECREQLVTISKEQFFCSPTYVAPEVPITNDRDYTLSKASDIYSLGCVLDSALDTTANDLIPILDLSDLLSDDRKDTLLAMFDANIENRPSLSQVMQCLWDEFENVLNERKYLGYRELTTSEKKDLLLVYGKIQRARLLDAIRVSANQIDQLLKDSPPSTTQQWRQGVLLSFQSKLKAFIGEIGKVMNINEFEQKFSLAKVVAFLRDLVKDLFDANLRGFLAQNIVGQQFRDGVQAKRAIQIRLDFIESHDFADKDLSDDDVKEYFAELTNTATNHHLTQASSKGF